MVHLFTCSDSGSGPAYVEQHWYSTVHNAAALLHTAHVRADNADATRKQDCKALQALERLTMSLSIAGVASMEAMRLA